MTKPPMIPNKRPRMLCEMEDKEREEYLRRFYAAERQQRAAEDMAQQQGRRWAFWRHTGALAAAIAVVLICAALGLGLGFAALAWAGYKP